MARVRVDGLALDVAFEVEHLPETTGDADWRVALASVDAPEGRDAVEWTGDVSHADGTWARFGRTRAANVVNLRDLVEVVASRRTRAATLRPLGSHAPGRLLRRVVPYLVALDRRLALHAATVVGRAGAILLCAEAGTGKSTLALAFDAAGRQVLGDDHVAVEVDADAVSAHRSFPAIEAGDEARSVFRPDAGGAPGKVQVLRRTEVPEVAPVAAIAFLRRAERAALAAMAASDAVARLLRETLFVADPADREEHEERLEQAARLVSRVPVFSLSVPSGLDRLREALPALFGLLDAPTG